MGSFTFSVKEKAEWCGGQAPLDVVMGVFWFEDRQRQLEREQRATTRFYNSLYSRQS